MEIYLLVLLIVIIISFVTGIFLSIYNKIVIKKHIKESNIDEIMSKTIRIDSVDNLGHLIGPIQNKSVDIKIVEDQNKVVNDPPIPIPIVKIESLGNDENISNIPVIQPIRTVATTEINIEPANKTVNQNVNVNVT